MKMDNLARVLDCEQVFLEYGNVTGREGCLFKVETGSGLLMAKKSVNCLVEPLTGDRVLISQADSGRSYILSILERENDGPSSLVFDGDVELKTRDGRLQLAAQEGIDLVTARDTALVSAELSVNTLRAEINFENIAFFGTLLQGQIAKIRLIGQTCDSVFDRVSQRVKRSYRRVEELEQLTAGQLSYLVKKLMSLRGKYSVLTAEEDVRIDGDKILMG
jgi:hypothetical protein